MVPGLTLDYRELYQKSDILKYTILHTLRCFEEAAWGYSEGGKNHIQRRERTKSIEGLLFRRRFDL